MGMRSKMAGAMCILVGGTLLYAATPIQVWQKTYSGGKSERLHSVRPTNDGGYILCGSTESVSDGEEDVLLLKTDSNGERQWFKTFGAQWSDVGYCAIQTNDGGYVVVGVTIKGNEGTESIFVRRTDGNGNMVCTKNIGGGEQDIAYSIDQSVDGGFIIAGWTRSQGSNGSALLVKLNNAGDQEWVQMFGGTEWDAFYSVSQTGDNGYIAAGETKSVGRGGSDALLCKVDENGSRQWMETFGKRQDESGFCAAQTADGGYILVGKTTAYDSEHDDEDILLIKTDAHGSEEWAREYGGNCPDVGYYVEQTTDGGYLMC
ncbi:MAG: hypothetical protein GF344_10070, partial [Chitinivibrionales bacterium]|nr:hypothetical protein [Chitinivibrionales bacterium]MBD3357180.1 hypothetical protein [Chitinivibrionales bacterium]